MCGILGSINVPLDDSYLEMIRHRGPDNRGTGVYRSGIHEILFFHRRLSIVDLSEAGAQPMYANDQGGCLIFNGEIYNHQELRRVIKDCSFRGHSDTESVVNYFRQNSPEQSLKNLNGIFAFAYLDFESGQLILARDRYGVKPLYYFFEDNKLCFASEISPLKKYLQPVLDKGTLVNNIRLRYSLSPFTIYRQIKKVEPGQALIFDLNDATITLSKKYFVPAADHLGKREGGLQHLVQEYGDYFEKAVARQVMSDVEIGIFLSGGVDSALVAAIAKNKTSKVKKAFTVGFDAEHTNVNEIDLAGQTAAYLGLEHHIKRIGFSDFLGLLKTTCSIVEEPIATTSVIPMYFLSELASKKVKVVLSGQGADEPLGGYNKDRKLLLLQKLHSYSKLLSITTVFRPLYNKREKWRRFISSLQQDDIIDSYLAFNSIFSLKDISNLLNKKVAEDYLKKFCETNQVIKDILNEKKPQQASVKDVFTYFDTRTSLPDDLLMYTDKITMHFSIECRVPALDNHLMDFIESIQSKFKFTHQEGKIIHKAFAAEYLPACIIDRKKLGFLSPTKYWFKKYSTTIFDIFNTNQKFKDLFNMSYVKQLLKEHSRSGSLDKQLFLLLSINYLLET